MAEKHKPAPMVDEVSEFEVLEIAVRELAIEKGLFSADDHRRWTEYMDTVGPLPAARLVAKAWLDPEFKKLAVTDGVKASLEVGIDWINDMPSNFGTPSDYCNLRVLEDTPTLKHVVVCTLCSCYPRPILGQSPEWYRTPNYRRRIIRWPRQVLAEFGLQLPEDVDIRVADSNQKSRFLVLPVRPEGTEGWSEEQLAEIVTRDCLIGVAVPKPGKTANDKRSIHPAINPVEHHHEAAKNQPGAIPSIKENLMTDINPDKIELDDEMASRNLDPSPIELLEKIKKEGRVWDDLCEQYGVDNPDPPWRVSLEGTCDVLAGGYLSPFNICKPKDEREPVNDHKLDAVERRWEEDKLVDQHYADVPFPERQLLALAHSMIRRGLIDEDELAKHMKVIDKRLNMS